MTNTPAGSEKNTPRPRFTVVTKLCLILAVVCCVLYSNTLPNDYALDDVMVITENKLVKQGFSGIPALFTTLHLKGFEGNSTTDYYRPLSLVMFAVEYEILGLNPTVGHAINILLFAACVVLLFRLLLRLFEGDNVVVAFVAALLFAVHPIHTEVVANIKSRDELLCFFLAFAALHLFIDYALKGRILHLLTGAVLFFLAILAKETAGTFMGIIPLVFFFYRNENWNRSFIITIVAAIVLVLFAAMLVSMLGGVSAVLNISSGAEGPAKLAPRLYVLGYHIKMLVIPYPLNFNFGFYKIQDIGMGNLWVLLSVAGYLLLIVVGLFRLFKYKRDPWAFGILFYLGTLALFSNMVFLLGQPYADRFAFFPSVGFCLIVALAFDKWILKGSGVAALAKVKPLAVLIPVLLCFSVMTIARNRDWKDNFTLVNADVNKAPGDAMMQYKAGLELQKKCETEPDEAMQRQLNSESIAHFLKAIEIDPDYTEAHSDIGVAYYRANDYESAEHHFKEVLHLNPAHLNAADNLGTLYFSKQQFADAAVYYNKALHLDSTLVTSWYNLAICYARLQQNDSSMICIKKVIAIAPGFDNYKSYGNAAILYKLMGNMDSAQRYEQMTRQYYPEFKL